jgi:diaminopimelate decarboxylase
MAVRAADRLIVLIDSFNELALLGQLAGAMQKEVRVGVRLTTNPEGLWRKFGILPEELALFWQRLQAFPNLLIQGLQFHTSWNLDAGAQLGFIKVLGGVLAKLPTEALGQIAFIDVGGGYWPEQGEWLQPAGTKTGVLRKALSLSLGRNKKHYCLPACSIESFARQLGGAVNTYIRPHVPSCCFCFEPGRWLCNDVMHILMSVVDKKGDDLVITDAGTNAVGWERFETDYFPVLNLSRPALKENACQVLGSLCTPHDVWGYNYWGEDIQIGDVLLVPTQGAYTYSLRQNFIKPVPEVFTIGEIVCLKL